MQLRESVLNNLQNSIFLEKSIKVPDWGENKEKNCLLDCNGNQGQYNLNCINCLYFSLNFGSEDNDSLLMTHRRCLCLLGCHPQFRSMPWFLWLVNDEWFLLLKRPIWNIKMSEKCQICSDKWHKFLCNAKWNPRRRSICHGWPWSWKWHRCWHNNDYRYTTGWFSLNNRDTTRVRRV